MPRENQFKTHEEYLNWYRKYREKNRDKLRNYLREYNKNWRKFFGYNNEEKWKKNNRNKFLMEGILQRAVNYGRIERLPCEVCGNPKSQGHHSDYSKPLEVIWLCALHHKKLHLILKNQSTLTNQSKICG